MPEVFKMTIEGDVGGKGRPRTRIIYQNGKAVPVIYPDPESAKAEALIKGLVFAKRHGKPLLEGPFEIEIEIFLPHPKSWSRAKRESAFGYYATGKPDTDNIAKLHLDALNKSLWVDDTRVSDLIVRRRYITDLDAPFTQITVREQIVKAEADLLARA